MRPTKTVLGLTLVLLAVGPAWGQIGLPSLGGVTQGLPSLPGVEAVVDLTRRTVQTAQTTVDQALTAPQRLRGLIRGSRGALEADPQGWPVATGELVALACPTRERLRPSPPVSPFYARSAWPHSL